MRFLVIVSTLVLAVVAAAPAGGGGWATVGFEPRPDGTKAGETWRPTIFVKQHGVTPLSGLQPVVTIEEADSEASATFYAEPGSEAGVYEADVVFPDPGEWRVTILSGFGDSQVGYGPVADRSPGIECPLRPDPPPGPSGGARPAPGVPALFPRASPPRHSLRVGALVHSRYGGHGHAATEDDSRFRRLSKGAV